MNLRHVSAWCAVAAVVAVSAGLGLGQATATQSDQAEGMEVLTRGPVHEAFAETITFDPQPGIVVREAPPDAIEEVPPDLRPEGDNVTWIPGYWGWDDDRNGYIWVSGIWRELPPDRQWVPGYWGEVDQGYQWSSGYWAGANDDQVEYLPEPPPTVEAGPNIAAPSSDYGWVPGCWVWQHGRYAWRPGYWQEVRQDWDWVPAHYIWAPRGYIYSDGYWDYPVGGRGVLFAPVYFDSRVYGRRGFSYSPSIVIDLNVFVDHLFVRPDYGHYYFGDYYAASYQDRGFFASFSFNDSRHGYDPTSAHQRWEHRQDAGWDRRRQTDFQDRRDHEEARPERTWAARTKTTVGVAQPAVRRPVVAAPFDQVTRKTGDAKRFQPVAVHERQGMVQRGREVQGFRTTRQRLESPAARPSVGKAPRTATAARVVLPRSPIVARSPAQLGKGHAPPNRPQAPKPDSRVKPAKTKGDGSPDKGRVKPNDRSRGR